MLLFFLLKVLKCSILKPSQERVNNTLALANISNNLKEIFAIKKTFAICLIAVCQDSKTSSRDVFKIPRRHFFSTTKMLIRLLKKTSQKCLPDTAKTTYEDPFKISKKQLFCNFNQPLSF